ncbi:lytic polysaccharide monooxygenase auxiliary activity family 9 protein [Catenuloplanes indicus]|uniref:Chitin-binding protein n=1 Tax=Catenuloplanes indicus TaxID=137267 RepID=A0AAE4B1H0_9ACTN|nr:lytic polysaccharide monooxygenase [Catenuloplanes indicus]MDQ0369631.1 chitin-binding protein [Catenuloplanes indicus]
MPNLRTLRRLLLATAAATLLLTTGLVDPASAHGSAVNPPSRNYGCWKRWGSDFQNPAMATQDPMCWQAWNADSTAMWNWNGLYRENVQGNHQAAIPDGTLCSAGNTGGTRYSALDTPGAWIAQTVPASFTLRMHDQAQHGADYLLTYVTKPGFDPLTQRLGWGDLQLAGQTGVIPPGGGQTESDPALNGKTYTVNVSAPGRTGRAVLYTIWKASHADQVYYFCSDVIFGGTGSNPAPTPSITLSPSVNPTPPSTPSPGPSTPNPGGACTATYAVTSQWNGGFQADVRVTNGGSAASGWSVAWTWQNGQQVTQSWGATISTLGNGVTVARNAGYNGALAANGSASFGFIGSSTGTNTAPLLSCTTVA